MSVSTTDLVESLSPHLSALSDTSTRDRPAKRRAIETVKKETQKIKLCQNASTTSIELLAQILSDLLVSTESEIESVREQTVNVFINLISNCEQGQMNEAITKKLLSATKLRMRKEETEEIRIAWTELCIALIAKIDESMSAEQSELWMDIIEVAAQDKFADVQKQMARLAVLYATQCPKLVDYACERMIRIIIPLLIHKHNAVRVAGIKALDAVLVASPKGLHLLFEYDSVLDRQPIIPSLVYDTSALVLDNLFSMLGKLLCEWDPRSRYQYGELILPVILSGTLNELPTVQATCKASLFKVGLSCTGDLVDAGVLDVFPTDEKEAEKIGLQHLIHMCYDKSVIYLIEQSMNFVQVRQETGLDSLKLLLEHTAVDDLVKSIKKLIQCLFQVFATSEGQPSTQERVYTILELITSRLPSPEICLEAIALKLDKKRLANEADGLLGNITVKTAIMFIEHILTCVSLSESETKRTLFVLEKPYLKEYMDADTLKQKQRLIQTFHKT